MTWTYLASKGEAMAVSNESLMWMSLGIWVIFILVLGYFAFFGKTTTALPSGNQVAQGPGAAQ